MSKKKSKTGLIILAVFLLTILLVFSYLGFIPFLSEIFNKPVDLGIKYTEKDLISAQQKSGIIKKDLPENTLIENSIYYTGKNNIDNYFTSQELTAWANSPHWKYYPLKDVQIRINNDNTAEVSGKIKTSVLDNYKKSINLKDEEADKALDYIKYLQNPSFYAKGKVEIKNNNVELDYEKIKINNFEIPKEYDNKIESTSTRLLFKIRNSVKGLDVLDVKEMKLENGNLIFKGTLPKEEYGLK
ncbi:MAG: hypothetical protein QW757_02220 [Candidatus Woesearchaeota archaeon]